MNVETISVATGVISAAIAALGLLLGWYLREENRRKKKNRRIFIAACVGVVALAASGVAVTFTLGSGAKAPVGPENPGSSMRLSEAQYRGQVGAVCSDAKERARRIQELQPRETVLGYVAKIEQDEVAQIAKLRPPDNLKNAHADMLSIWQRRIGLLESVYHRLPQLGDSEQLFDDLATADRLSTELAESFKSLGVPECTI